MRLLLGAVESGIKPNVEGNLNSRFVRGHSPAQAAIKKARILAKEARISCAFPLNGIQDNTVNRLLLMSSSERHLPNVRMAFFIEGQASGETPVDRGAPVTGQGGVALLSD
jgi:hypothetical protein